MSPETSYASAINRALVDSMEADKTVFCYGIGVPDHMGIFGTTTGLGERFGPERSFDTPISEDSLMGFGLGAALAGLRPVNIHIRVDFLMLAMNQLVNQISSYQFGNQGQTSVPLTIRAVVGRGWGQGYQHSKSLHSLFTHIPGLEVFAPATVSEAYQLTRKAIESDNPSLLIEHRWLYWHEGPMGGKDDRGKGYSELSDGVDVLVIATSWMVVEAVLASKVLADQGIGVKVISLSTLHGPLPEDVLQLASQIGLVVVADNDYVFSGYGAEVSSQLHEHCFSDLQQPVARLGFPSTPTPTARHMEDAFYPNANTIISAIGSLLQKKFRLLDQAELYSHENKFKGPF